MASEVTDITTSPEAGAVAIRGSALRVGGYGIGMLLSLISVPLLIRHLDGNYWRYVTVIAIVTVVQGITDVGLSQIGVREYSTHAGPDRGHFMANLLGIRASMTAVGVLLGTLFAIVAGYGQTVVLGTLLVGAAMVLTVIQGTFGVPLASRLRLGWVTLLELVRQVLTVGSVVALVLVGARLLAFFAVTVPIALCVLLLTAVVVRDAMPRRPSFDRRKWVMIMRSVLPFVAAAVIATFYLRITVILMSLMATPQQNNYYAIAFSVVTVLVALPPLTVGSLLPILAVAAKDDETRMTYVISRLTEITLIVGAGMGLALAIGAPFVVRVLSGATNAPAATVLQIMSVAILTQFTASAWTYGLLALHEHRSMLAISGLSLVVSVTVTAVLIPMLQAEGAAIGFAAAECAMAGGTYWFLRAARARKPVSGLRVPVRVFVALAGGLSVLLLPIGSFGQAVLSFAVYFAVLVISRSIPPEIAAALGGVHLPRLGATSRASS